MEIISSQYFGLACTTFLVLGIIMLLEKDRENESRQTTRTVGIVLVILSAALLVVRFYLQKGQNLSGGGESLLEHKKEKKLSCFGAGSGKPGCTIPNNKLTFFEKVLSAIGLENYSQSLAKSRYPLIDVPFNEADAQARFANAQARDKYRRSN